MLKDGLAHSVDSSELAFRLAGTGAFREAFNKASPTILEPIMTVEVVAPSEFQNAVIGGLNQRRGTIVDSEVREDEFTAVAEVALNDMFGYSSHLRGVTQGKGEFSMEYKVRRIRSRPLGLCVDSWYSRCMHLFCPTSRRILRTRTRRRFLKPKSKPGRRVEDSKV